MCKHAYTLHYKSLLQNLHMQKYIYVVPPTTYILPHDSIHMYVTNNITSSSRDLKPGQMLLHITHHKTVYHVTYAMYLLCMYSCSGFSIILATYNLEFLIRDHMAPIQSHISKNGIRTYLKVHFEVIRRLNKTGLWARVTSRIR